MTHFKLTGFRFNKLQWIAEIATQKMVLYLQPEIKNELKSMSRSTFKIMCLITIALIIRTLETIPFRIGNGLETT